MKRADSEPNSATRTTLGARTLLVNPPPINGIRFTRQGRCQEREDVLGTAKPPFSLVVLATCLRQRGFAVELVDQNASGKSSAEVIRELRRQSFEPTMIVFCSSFPTLEDDAATVGRFKQAFDAPLFCFGPHSSCAPDESMQRAASVDGMIVGEPEDAVCALASLSGLDELESVPSLTFRRGEEIVPHRESGRMAEFEAMPVPAWEELDLDKYRLPLVNESYVIVETSRGCPYTCDFCVAPILQGNAFRERSPESIVNEIETIHVETGVRFFYLWGDTVTLRKKSFADICRSLADRQLPIRWFGNSRAEPLADLEFVELLRDSGCWMLSMGIESGVDEILVSMEKKLRKDTVRVAIDNLRRAGIKSFGFFIYGHPDDTVDSMRQTTAYACELGLDFASFYPAVPYPGTALYALCDSRGLLPDEVDWSRLEYSFYILQGDELGPETVQDEIRRARRKFFLRPRYLARRLPDIARILWTKPAITARMVRRTLSDLVGTSPLEGGTGATEKVASG